MHPPRAFEHGFAHDELVGMLECEGRDSDAEMTHRNGSFRVNWGGDLSVDVRYHAPSLSVVVRADSAVLSKYSSETRGFSFEDGESARRSLVRDSDLTMVMRELHSLIRIVQSRW